MFHKRFSGKRTARPPLIPIPDGHRVSIRDRMGSMRALHFAPFEYYHLYNRGVDRQQIFLEERDYARFLFCILHKQSPDTTHTNSAYYIPAFIDHREWKITQTTLMEIVGRRAIELTAFCLMGNHFHLLVRETKEGGVSKYLQRVLNAYTKYFNGKYKRKGHLFEGPFKAVHVKDNAQLLHLSAYLHRNPRELHAWKDREFLYPWSTLSDFTKENRWGQLIAPEVILSQFGDTKDAQQRGYKKFVGTSPAKKFTDELQNLMQ